MIIEVGNIIKSYLQPLAFIDKLAGVVKVITKTDQDANNKPVIKKFPVACDVDYDQCMSTGIYKDLVPDSSIGCIVFLEDLGLRKTGTRGRKEQWKGSYKLLSWVNNAKLGYADCSITKNIVVSIMKQFPVVPANNGIYQQLRIEVLGEEPKSGQNPFSKYTFSEEQTQYLMYPFDYFSLLIDVTFEIDKRCIVPFEKLPSIPCK